MFNQIGRKIKTLAQVISVLGIAFSIVFGIAMFGSDNAAGGLGLMIGGSLFSWLGSFFIYGFGELIEKVTEIAENSKHSL